jgi:hypothetical protein
MPDALIVAKRQIVETRLRNCSELEIMMDGLWFNLGAKSVDDI